MIQFTGNAAKCPVCGSGDVTAFLKLPQVPVHCNVLLSTREEALGVPRGDISLGYCARCAHVFNLAFDPGLIQYGPGYENSLHFSPRFQQYAESLAARLINDYGLRGKVVIEIGCGRGEFLRLLCELGGNRGIGFDPSYLPEPTGSAVEERLVFIQDLYSERYADYKADLLCSRHTLEHIEEPANFLLALRRAVGECRDAVVFIEVPNLLFILRDLSIWDVIYEHCSYFSRSSLACAFAACGFTVCELAEAYEGQFLCIEARPNGSQGHSGQTMRTSLDEVAGGVPNFASRYRDKVDVWRRNIERIRQAGLRAVAWGAGSKGVTFLNVLGIRDEIQCVVDINPRKHGMYVAGTGQPIVSPESLLQVRPDVVVVMNPIYRGEIERTVARLGITVEVVCA